MSAPSWLRPDAMPPWAFPAPTHVGVPVVSTSSCLTEGDVVDSSVAIAAVPTRMPSTGMIGKPYLCDHLPDRYSAARSGVPMPPPTQSVMLDSLRRSEYVETRRSSRSSHEW